MRHIAIVVAVTLLAAVAFAQETQPARTVPDLSAVEAPTLRVMAQHLYRRLWAQEDELIALRRELAATKKLLATYQSPSWKPALSNTPPEQVKAEERDDDNVFRVGMTVEQMERAYGDGIGSPVSTGPNGQLYRIHITKPCPDGRGKYTVCHNVTVKDGKVVSVVVNK